MKTLSNHGLSPYSQMAGKPAPQKSVAKAPTPQPQHTASKPTSSTKNARLESIADLAVSHAKFPR